jgi:DNA repair exonuclease SbcCD nuclease subunit
MKFVHTADWHLGHVYRRLGPLAGASFHWRFEAVRRVFDLAIVERADFILVAGDVFDSDTPAAATRQAALELLRDAPVPTYLISGNHDPCAEGSVWFHPEFGLALENFKNVHLALDREPVELLNGEAVLFPCAARAKHTREDVTDWIPTADRARSAPVRIGLAHGGWRGYWANAEYSGDVVFNEIDDRCAERCGLDYLALGDYHGFTPPNHVAAKQRTFYSGAPEVGANDNARAGYALLVELATPGAEPQVTPHVVGRLQCCDWGVVNLKLGDGIQPLEERLAAVTNHDAALVRTAVTGCISHNEWREVQAWIGGLHERVLAVDIELSKLDTAPTREDFFDLNLEKTEKQLLERLSTPLETQELLGVDAAVMIADWSRDDAVRQAARHQYFQLLRGDY